MDVYVYQVYGYWICIDSSLYWICTSMETIFIILLGKVLYLVKESVSSSPQGQPGDYRKSMMVKQSPLKDTF